jgi:hypothetical protein
VKSNAVKSNAVEEQRRRRVTPSKSNADLPVGCSVDVLVHARLRATNIF